MKYAFSILFFLLMALMSSCQNLSEFFSKADQFFKVYVKEGSVDYSAIKNQKQDIAELYELTGKVNLSSASANEKKAFYINAYNLLVIKSIVDHYPVKSPMDVEGFFKEKKHKIAGEQLTLDEIENKKIREVYSDARIHFALVCGAKSCPPLSSFAYLPEKLDKDLNEKTREALEDKNFVRVDYKNQQVKTSQIFDWYRQDFIDETGSILAFLNKYRYDKIPSDFNVNFYEYDWSLNDVH